MIEEPVKRDDVEQEMSCCGLNNNYNNNTSLFLDREDWTKKDFLNHGNIKFPYHPFNIDQLTFEQRKNAIHTVWILPYAHKLGMSSSLNAAIVDICKQVMTRSGGGGDDCKEEEGLGLNHAIAAFTVHPDDGIQGVRQTTIEAIKQGGARAAKLHCSVGNYSILHANLEPFWQLASIVLFPVIVHLGTSTSGNTATDELKQVEQLMTTYPNVRLIIAHTGHPAVQRAIKMALKFSNVYLDTTPVGE